MMHSSEEECLHHNDYLATSLVQLVADFMKTDFAYACVCISYST